MYLSNCTTTDVCKLWFANTAVINCNQDLGRCNKDPGTIHWPVLNKTLASKESVAYTVILFLKEFEGHVTWRPHKSKAPESRLIWILDFAAYISIKVCMLSQSVRITKFPHNYDTVYTIISIMYMMLQMAVDHH